MLLERARETRCTRGEGLTAVAISIVLTVLCAVGCAVATTTTTPQRSVTGWTAPDERVASTASARRRALTRLGLASGARRIALVTLGCDACDRAVRDLDWRGTTVVIISPSPLKEMDVWASRLKLRHVRYISVAPRTFEALGAVELPAIIEVLDGEYKRVRADGKL